MTRRVYPDEQPSVVDGPIGPPPPGPLLEGRQVLRFLVTGGLNAVLTCAVYVAGLYLLEWHYLVSLVVAFLCGSVFSYVLSFVWVFQPEARFNFRRRFLRFLASNSGTFGVNLLALWYAVEHLGGDPLIWQAILMVAVVVANFLSAKLWSLRRHP